MSRVDIKPEILIISSKHDYSTDHVAFQLDRVCASYLRLNRDQFQDFEISLFPDEQKLIGRTESFSFQISSKILKSIYFRAPVYLRDTYQPNLSPDHQLARSQWAAFIRAFSIFDDVLWVNNPQSTYKAEIKPYQLYIAHKIGFRIPKTVITNHSNENKFDKYERMIIKTLDPVILNINLSEAFIYTNFINKLELYKANISSAPVIIQEAIVPKIDVRVTVVGNCAYPVSITINGNGIDKDWRLEKNQVQFNKIDVPKQVNDMCIELTRLLGLQFAGIDLAIKDGEYYFIEINPTGEWAWLLEPTRWPIDEEIANLLIRGRGSYE